jgi:hypothetical protein
MVWDGMTQEEQVIAQSVISGESWREQCFEGQSPKKGQKTGPEEASQEGKTGIA